MSITLSHEEIIDLTGTDSVQEQMRWLKSRGWVFVMSNGVPKIARGHYEQMQKTDLEKPDRLLSRKAVVGRSKPIETFCGVYFLIQDDEIVYVGQSKDVYRRIGVHFADKVFNRTYVLKANESDLLWLEGMYIQKLKPKYNFAVPFVYFNESTDIERLKAIEDANT
jgi:hypothetical protein